MPIKKIFVFLFIAAILAGCGVSTRDSLLKEVNEIEQQDYLAAEKAFKDKDYQRADMLYTAFVNKYEKSKLAPKALLKSGLINETRDKSKSIRIYSKIISKYKNSDSAVEAAILGGNLLIGTGEYKKAEKLTQKVLNSYISDDDKIRILFVKANALFYLNKNLKAVESYWQIYQYNNEQYMAIRPYLVRSASRMNEDELIDASLLFLNPDAVGLFKKYYAMHLTKKNEYARAKKVLNDIIAAYPDTKTAYEVQNEIKLIKNINDFKIGCILPLSGKFQDFGEMALRGIQLALSEFKSRNKDITIRLLVENNQSMDAKSGEAAQKLIDKGVSAIIGPFHTADHAADVAEKNSTPIIVMTHRPMITENRNFVFRNFITQKMQAKALVEFSNDILNINTFAVLYPDEPYGEKFKDIFWDAVDESHGKIMGVEKYNPDSTDYSGAIKKITGLFYEDLRALPENEEEEDFLESEEKNPVIEEVMTEEQSQDEVKTEVEEEEKELESIVDFKAVFIPDGPAKAGSIAPQFAYFDVKDVVFLGPNLWESQDLIEYSEGYLNRAVFTSLFSDKSSNPVSIEFSTSYESIFGAKPGFIEAISYDSAMIIFNSARDSKAASPALVRDVIANTPVFNGVTGKTSFGVNGECIKELLLLEADSRGIREIN